MSLKIKKQNWFNVFMKRQNPSFIVHSEISQSGAPTNPQEGSVQTTIGLGNYNKKNPFFTETNQTFQSPDIKDLADLWEILNKKAAGNRLSLEEDNKIKGLTNQQKKLLFIEYGNSYEEPLPTLNLFDILKFDFKLTDIAVKINQTAQIFSNGFTSIIKETPTDSNGLNF